jgi:hypothetical protein
MEEWMTTERSGPEMTLTADNELRYDSGGEGESLSDVGAKAAEAARRKGEELREGLGTAKQAAAERAEATIDRAAEDIERTARALGDAAGGMQGGMPQGLLREASAALTELSQAMRGRSLSELVGQIEDFGRRNPPAFLGGAAIAGFALARFGVASARSGDREESRHG